MSFITFTSDFGDTDHYVAVVKANIFSVYPEARVVDISHKIQPFDIAHAAFTVGAVFREFPKNTVHLVMTDIFGNEQEPSCIALRSEGHYFVGVNNGLFSLIFEQKPDEIIVLPKEEGSSYSRVLARTAAELAKGTDLHTLGTAQNDLRVMLERTPKLTKNGIRGQVIHSDFFGNLTTNIRQADFERIRQDRGFVVRFAREHIDVIDSAYNARSAGECVLLFNDSKLLEIAINKGHAAELLGMTENSPVTIQFIPEFD